MVLIILVSTNSDKNTSNKKNHPPPHGERWGGPKCHLHRPFLGLLRRPRVGGPIMLEIGYIKQFDLYYSKMSSFSKSDKQFLIYLVFNLCRKTSIVKQGKTGSEGTLAVRPTLLQKQIYQNVFIRSVKRGHFMKIHIKIRKSQSSRHRFPILVARSRKRNQSIFQRMKFFPEVIYEASDYGKPKGRKSMKNLQKHAEVNSASSQFLYLAIGQILTFLLRFFCRGIKPAVK